MCNTKRSTNQKDWNFLFSGFSDWCVCVCTLCVCFYLCLFRWRAKHWKPIVRPKRCSWWWRIVLQPNPFGDSTHRITWVQIFLNSLWFDNWLCITGMWYLHRLRKNNKSRWWMARVETEWRQKGQRRLYPRTLGPRLDNWKCPSRTDGGYCFNPPVNLVRHKKKQNKLIVCVFFLLGLETFDIMQSDILMQQLFFWLLFLYCSLTAPLNFQSTLKLERVKDVYKFCECDLPLTVFRSVQIVKPSISFLR